MKQISQNNSAVVDFSFLLENCSVSISENKHRLESLLGSSEREFLTIGGKLQNFLLESKSLGETASKTASSVSDELLNNGISELSELLKEFGEIINHSSTEIKSDKEDLLEISKKVNLIVDELDGFRSIIKKLRMLGVATKIESARLGTDDNGFNALAESVDNLSALIGNKVDSIKRKSSALFSQINSTTDELTKLELKHQEQSDIILNNTSLSLKAFENKHSQCFQKTEKISSNTQNVVSNIRDIVTSIQFHDITRQQIEHVCEALDEILVYETNREEFNAEYSKAEMMHDVCDLQVVQLRNSINEFENAVESIIKNLNGVADNINSIYNEISSLLKDKNAKEGSSIEEINSELKSVTEGLNKSKEIEKQLSHSIKSVISILDELSQYLLQIEDIGTEIEIIALNARVKAARTGDKGGALGVLAEAILNLSLEAKKHTASTTNVLTNIVESSQKLKTNLEADNSENSGGNLVSINQKINHLLQTLILIDTQTGNSISKMSSEVNSLNSEIVNTIEGITINRTMSGTISEVISELSTVVYELKMKANLTGNRDKHIQKLQNKYTMHSERRIHKSFTNDWSLKEEKIQTNNSSQDDLGDNVELF